MAKAAAAEPQTQLEKYLRAAAPFLTQAGHFANAVYPHLEAAVKAGYAAYLKVAPYQNDFGPLLLGAILLFCGGSLPLTIAAVEAFRLCGWDKTKVAVTVLYEQFKIAREASAKDDQVDDNKDGIADVKQINAQQLLTRKVALFFRVTDPARLNEGIAGITAGTAAVIAVLRNQFAQSIALGTSLGDIFNKSADKFLKPTLLHIVPKEFHKWIPTIIEWLCRSVAISIAWWCQRVISAMHSAMRGSDILLRGVFALLATRSVSLPLQLSPSHEAYPALVTALGVFGFWYQLSRFFGIPFPLNILLLPLRIFEGVLAWTLAYGK